jgi:hypothetical protein
MFLLCDISRKRPLLWYALNSPILVKRSLERSAGNYVEKETKHFTRHVLISSNKMLLPPLALSCPNLEVKLRENVRKRKGDSISS